MSTLNLVNEMMEEYAAPPSFTARLMAELSEFKRRNPLLDCCPKEGDRMYCGQPCLRPAGRDSRGRVTMRRPAAMVPASLSSRFQWEEGRKIFEAHLECPGQAWDEAEKVVAEKLARHRAKKAARRHGVAYWPAFLWRSDEGFQYPVRPSDLEKVDPEAFRVAEEIISRLEAPLGRPGQTVPGWDNMGHYGVTHENIRRAWMAAGCKNSRKYRLLISLLWKNRGEVPHGTRIPLAKGMSERKIKACVAGQAFIEGLKGAAIIGWDLSRSSLVALGRLPIWARLAAVQGLTRKPEGKIGPSELNWDRVREVRAMRNWQRTATLARTTNEAWWWMKGEPAPLWAKAATPKGGVLSPATKVAQEMGKVVAHLESLVADLQFGPDLALPIRGLVELFGTFNEAKKFVKGSGPNAWHDAGQFLEMVDHSRIKDRMGWVRLVCQTYEAKQFASMWADVEAQLGRAARTLTELRETAAKFLYAGSAGFERLAIQAQACKLDQSAFDRYKTFMVGNVKQAEACPAVRVTGEEVGLDGSWLFEKLAYDDPAGPMLGLLTDCCQHLDGAGAFCARHGWKSPTGGFYVVRYNGKVVAQSWAWRGTCGELCFDNIEALAASYKEGIEALYREAAKRLVKGPLMVTKVTVGTGYQDVCFAGARPSRNLAQRLGDNQGYTDADSQICLAGELTGSDSGYFTVDYYPSYSKLGVASAVPAAPAAPADPEPVFNVLMEDSGVFCEHCDAEVHPDAQVCPSCGRDISGWVEEDDEE